MVQGCYHCPETQPATISQQTVSHWIRMSCKKSHYEAGALGDNEARQTAVWTF